MVRRISVEYSCDRRRRIHRKHLLGGVARPRPSRDCPGQSSGRASCGRAARRRFRRSRSGGPPANRESIRHAQNPRGDAFRGGSVGREVGSRAEHILRGERGLRRQSAGRNGATRRGQADFSSTAATYGEPEVVPIPEDHRQAPINPYGKSKLRFEQILADYRAYTGLKYVTVRYFNAAGASKERGENHRVETHLIPRALDTALGRFPEMEIFGFDYPTPDGTCVRDFVHVLDIADSHLLALEEIDRVQGEAFNVGTTSGYSNLQVVQAAERITGRKVPHKLSPRRPGDPAT